MKLREPEKQILDDLDFIENEYSGRVQNTLSSYSTLLYSLLQENNWEQ